MFHHDAQASKQAHWRFDGNAEDSTANNLDGTPQYDATFSTAGAPIVGNAGSLSLDGAQDYLLVGDEEKLKLRTYDLSLSIWFKPDVNSVMQLITQGNVWASGGQGYDLSYHGGDSPKTIEFRVNDGSGSYQAVTETLSSGLSGAWHHVAVTVDRDGDVVIYLDGAEVERAAFNQTANSDIQGSVAFVGGGHDGGTWTFDGLLDDMRVYRGDGVLSAADVTKLYTSSDSLPALPSVGAKRVYYTYDALDRRIKKEIDANGDGDFNDTGSGDEVDQFVYDGQNIVFRAGADGSLKNRYLHGPAVDQILADEQYSPLDSSHDNPATETGNVYWPLTDHLGSVRELVDSTGAIKNRITYDAFGQITAEKDGSGNAHTHGDSGYVDHIYGYTGQERDYESDLDYYNARYYIPSLGRFANADPIGFAAGDENLYRYVGNHPTYATDPSGFDEWATSDGEYGSWEDRVPDEPEDHTDEPGFEVGPRRFSDEERKQILKWAGLEDHVPIDPGIDIPFGRGQSLVGRSRRTSDCHEMYAEENRDRLASIGGGPPGWLVDGLLFVGGMAFEPLDWGLTLGEIIKDPTHWASYAGLIPGIPAGTSRVIKKIGGEVAEHIDDVGRALGRAGDEAGDAANSTGRHFADLTDDRGRRHILDGEPGGAGGHRPGTGRPGKSEFPPDWDDDRILHEVSDVATDPASTVTTLPGGRQVIEGTRDRTSIRVITDPTPSGGRRIVTGYPTNRPRNP